MIETLLALGIALALCGSLLTPLSWLLAAGAAGAGAGLLLGVPTGLVYHLALRRALAARAELPQRWWLQPTRLHERLRDDERDAVLVWFYAGGAGFLLTSLGCAALGVAALRLVLGGGAAV